VNVPLPKELKWIRSTKYILFIGTRVKYKNFDQAVMAVEMLRGYNLVIIGGGDLRREEQSLLERSLKGRYRHLLGMPEEVLNIIYNHAFCLLYSSSYEGFGFPPLEAMQAGCPVVAVNTSSLPEVCGDAGLLVKNPEAELFYNEIISLEDSHLRHTVVEKGMTQATMFNWDRTFQKTMTFYQEIAGGFSGVGTTS
jgi:mannosyltransferase